MGLSWAFRATWFALSLVGLLQSFVVMTWIGRKLLSRWIRMTYLAGTIILQGVFCLGMIWHLDPYAFPRWFCIAQALGWSLGADLLTAAAASFSLASSYAVLRPVAFKAGSATDSIFAWHHRYIPLVVIFPIVAFGFQATLTFKLDAARPIPNGMQCDSLAPSWMLLMGYAGPPQLLTIPFLVISTYTAIHLQRVRKRMISSHYPNSDVFIHSLPDHQNIGETVATKLKRLSRVNSTASNSAGRSSTFEDSPIPLRGFKPKVLALRGMTVPAKLLRPTDNVSRSSTFSHDDASLTDSGRVLRRGRSDLESHLGSLRSGPSRSRAESFESRLDFLMPTFAPNPSLPALSVSNENVAAEGSGLSADQKPVSLTPDDAYGPMSPHSAQSPLHGIASSESPFHSNLKTADDGGRANLDDPDEDDDENLDWRQAISSPPSALVRGQSINMAVDFPGVATPDRQTVTSTRPISLDKQMQKALWRMILFQMVFFLTELLCALTPLICVIKGRDVAFGTQQVALILSAWAPIIIFGHTETVKHAVTMAWPQLRGCCRNLPSKMHRNSDSLGAVR